MFSYFKCNPYCSTSFGFTDASREVLILDEDSRVDNLATYLFYHKPDYVPEIPLIEIIAEPHMKRKECMPNSILADYISIGSYYFVSQRLKDIFDKFKVDAFYSDTVITVSGEKYPDPYYIFSPKIAVDAIDRHKSTYVEESEDPVAVRINTIKHLVLDEKNVSDDLPLFVLAGTCKRIYLINEKLANELLQTDIVGMDIKPVDEGEWVY